MKKGWIALGCLIASVITVAAGSDLYVIFWIPTLVFWIWWLIDRREIRKMKKAVRREAKRMKEAQRSQLRYERQEAAAIAAERRRQDHRPVAVVLVSTVDQRGKSITGTAARGLVGYALLGPLGAIGGMVSGKDRVTAQKATFSVRYESGRTAVETVDVNSGRFRELAELLVREDSV